jgi:hypothetical protein
MFSPKKSSFQKPLSSLFSGRGWLSVMAKIELVWAPVDPTLPTTIIAKIPTSSKIQVFLETMPEMKDMVTNLVNQLHMVGFFKFSKINVFSKKLKKTISVNKLSFSI